jgi:mono/diheme cytochrome c family protein
MNTSKQVNIMIGTVLLAILMYGGYIGYESTRQAEQRVEVTEKIAERGARLFVSNCRGCHGLDGEGHVGPPLNRPAFRILGANDPSGAPATPQGEADAVNAFLFNTISCGRTNTFMPLWAQRFGGSLSDTQVHQLTTLITEGRWDLVKQIGEEHDAEVGATAKDILVDAGTLSLTEKNCGQYTADNAADIRGRDPFAAGGAAPAAAAAAAPAAAAPAAGPAAEGKTLATANGCTACHSTGGAAGVGPTWKGLDGEHVTLADGSTVTADDAYLKESIVSPDAKIVKGFAPGIMPKNFGEKLNDTQIAAIIAYIKTLK